MSKHPEMSDVIPIKCETCRFWKMTNSNRQPWGHCSGIRTNTENLGAYLSDDFATAGLDTLPHFFCCLWKAKLPDAVCEKCDKPIRFNVSSPAWQHIDTGYAVCGSNLADEHLNSTNKWAEPKEPR